MDRLLKQIGKQCCKDVSIIFHGELMLLHVKMAGAS